MQPTEVLVVDDGSKDGTAKIIEKFSVANKYPIKILRNPTNMGIGFTRTVGGCNAKGDYVAYLSSDDCYHPKFIEQSKPYLDKNTATYTTYYRCNNYLEPKSIFWPEQFSKDSVTKWALSKNMYVNFSTVIYPKNIFDKCKFEPALRHGEDLIFLLDTVLAGYNYQLINEPLCFYRIHDLAGSFRVDPVEFTTTWFYLNDRLRQLEVPHEKIEEGYRISRKRAIPSLQRKIASKTYHFAMDHYTKIRLNFAKQKGSRYFKTVETKQSEAKDC